MELQTFTQESLETLTKVDPPSLKKNNKPQTQEVLNEETRENGTQVTLLENHLRQSSESLRTEVQAEDLNREELGTDSGSADTSAPLLEHPQNLSLVMQKIVCEETAAQPIPDSEGESNHSQQITFEAEVHHNENEEVSDSPEPQIMNAFPFNIPPSSMHSAEYGSDENCVHMYTQPLADTSGASSQLFVAYTSMQPDSHRNDRENCSSSPIVMRDRNGVDESSSTLPLQNMDNSHAYLLVGDTNTCSSHFLPDEIRRRYHQYDDRTNTVEFEQLTAHVTGEDLSVETEPNNDRHLMDSADVHVVRQISAASSQR